MTEAEWLVCNDPEKMLNLLRQEDHHLRLLSAGRRSPYSACNGISIPSKRKLQLFYATCCRRVWHLLKDERSRRAVCVAELDADGLASKSDCVSASAGAIAVVDEMYGGDPEVASLAPHAAECPGLFDPYGFSSPPGDVSDWAAMAITEALTGKRSNLAAEYQGEQAAQAALLRCIIGNPFHAVTVDPSWLAWNNGTVVNLAQAIYDDRAFDRMPILADALEDAGCSNADILEHCRNGGEHVRGCWVVDLLLAKA